MYNLFLQICSSSSIPKNMIKMIPLPIQLLMSEPKSHFYTPFSHIAPNYQFQPILILSVFEAVYFPAFLFLNSSGIIFCKNYLLN